MRDVISFLFGVLSVFFFVTLLGAVGDVERGNITLEYGVGKMLLWLLCFVGCVLLSKLVWKGEKEVRG